MSYQSVSHVSHESYPIPSGPPPSSGFMPPDPPRPLPPRPGYGGHGYQAYFGGTDYNPPSSYHTHHQQFDYPYENPCFSLVRGCLAALCCCFLLEQCCFW
ncbi:hypothetical protein AKJ16_DCAP23149 [Drosera capensis]